jgi:POT family proton-dependent oligopeptide transporter
VSLIYCAGHAVLAVAGRFDAWQSYDTAAYLMYAGLALIAVGSGGIKPCVSANVGDQFTGKNRHLVTQVFQIFYFIINFGSFLSTILTPLLYGWFGPEVAFGVPGIFMAVATVIFWLGRNRFVHVKPNPGGQLGMLDFFGSVLLFTPIIALIVAVFVEGGHFEVGSIGEMSKLAFYADYVVRYVGFLVVSSWPYFLVAALLFGMGLVLFSVRQRRQQDTGFLAMVLYAYTHRGERKPGDDFFSVVREKFGDEAADGPPAVLRIIVVFSMVSVFWALFDQHASTWIEQARQMHRALTVPTYLGGFAVGGTLAAAVYGGVWLFSWVSNRTLPRKASYGFFALLGAVGLGCAVADGVSGGTTEIELKAAQIAALNPLMVMIIIPGLQILVYKPLEKRGREVRPLQKMTVGMFMAAVAFAVAALLQQVVEAGGEDVHVLWQVLQYVVMTTAEVLVSVTGLEFAYTQAPRTMKSTIMGFWLLCVTFGNVLVAFLAPMQTILSLSQFFWVFTGLMTAAALIFALMAKLYKGRTYLQEEAA